MASSPNVSVNIDVSNHIGQEDITSITLVIKNVTTYGVKIYLEDTNLSTNRPVVENQMFGSGDNIEIAKHRDGQKKESKQYSISFSKSIFVEEDVSKNCKNYPNKEYETYKACEDLSSTTSTKTLVI